MAQKEWLKVFPPRVLFFPGDRSEEINPMSSVLTNTIVSTPDNLPLVVEPGAIVKWGERNYSLEKEGRYCFMEGHRLVRQVIVYKRDKMALFRGLAQIQVHGHRHDGLNFQEILEVAKKGRVSLTCGSISSFICKLLPLLGIKARMTITLTMDEWNGYNNGHTMVEYWDSDLERWILLDVDGHCLFKIDDKLLNLLEFCTAVNQGKNYDVVHLTKLGLYDYGDCLDNGMDQTCFFDDIFHDGTALKLWHKRIAQTCGIFFNNKFIFCAEDLGIISRIQSYSEGFYCLPRKEWVKLFYGMGQR